MRALHGAKRQRPKKRSLMILVGGRRPDDGQATVPEGAAMTVTTLDYALIRDMRTDDVRSMFIRLVRPGEQTPAHTVDAECTVDFDADHQVIGVTIHQYGEETRW